MPRALFPFQAGVTGELLMSRIDTLRGQASILRSLAKAFISPTLWR